MTAKRQSPSASQRTTSVAAGGAVTDVDPGWAWAEYEPDGKRPWTPELAGHLLRRTTFGAAWQQHQQAAQAGPRRTIDLLIRPEADVASFERTMSQDEEAVARGSSIESLRAWWLRRMIKSPHPLQEKMTLFWHSHFGVSHSRVKEVQPMLRHVQTLREHALGSYRSLLEAAARDPAVLVSVGAAKSPKMQPNENFIRQLMQQYSVGPGHFGDEDVREAARAFTGWSVLRGRLRYLAHEHDEGSKDVLGSTGQWDADDIVRIVLEQPATPRLIARKLYRFLVSEVDQPGDPLLEPVAEMLAQQYDVGQVVETILRSNLFFSPRAYRRRVKSPVEYSLSLVRALGDNVATLPLGAALAQLGQDLYDPPTVSGWVGGTHWINAATMLARAQLADSMLASKGPYGGTLVPADVATQHGCSSAPPGGGAAAAALASGRPVSRSAVGPAAVRAGQSGRRIRRWVAYVHESSGNVTRVSSLLSRQLAAWDAPISDDSAWVRRRTCLNRVASFSSRWWARRLC